MKRFSILLIFMTILVVNMNAQRTYALLTGVSNYGDEQLNLHNTTKDVKQLKTVMDKLGVVCGVSTSKNVTQANITKRLNTILFLRSWYYWRFPDERPTVVQLFRSYKNTFQSKDKEYLLLY